MDISVRAAYQQIAATNKMFVFYKNRQKKTCHFFSSSNRLIRFDFNETNILNSFPFMFVFMSIFFSVIAASTMIYKYFWGYEKKTLLQIRSATVQTYLIKIPHLICRALPPQSIIWIEEWKKTEQTVSIFSSAILLLWCVFSFRLHRLFVDTSPLSLHILRLQQYIY